MSEYPLDWSISNLGAYIQETKERAGDSDATPYSVSKVLGIVPQSEKFNKRVASNDISNYKVIREGDFAYDPMLLWDGSINRMLRDEIGAVSPAYVTFKVSSGSLDADYLLHFLKASTTKNFYKSISKGTNVRRQKAEFSDFAAGEFAFPPLPEQKKIAEILSGIDRQIKESKRKLVSIQRFRNAFLEEYFSRGISIAENPVDSSWSLHCLVDLLEDEKRSIRSGPFGSALLKSELTESGFPFLGIDNVQTEKFIRKYKRYVGEEKFAELQRYEVFPGDVIITIMGTVGRCCVIPEIKERCLSSKHTWTMTFRKDLIPPEIACWQLNHFSRTRKHFTESGQGGVMDSISSSTLKNTKIPLPSNMQELKKVAGFYTSSLRAERKLSFKISKLQNIKTGLSADLLSGRKRVSI